MGQVISRREFIAGSAAALIGAHCGLSEETKPIEVIDTHTHFYDPERPEGVPWPPRGDQLLYRRVLPADYIALARPQGIAGTVVVEASSRVEDNQWLLDLADREPFLLGIVGNLDPLAPEFANHLKRFSAHPRFRGIRIGGKQLSERGGDAVFLEVMKRLADGNLSLDLNGARTYVAHVAALARAVPTLRIVLDHVASAGDAQALDAAWRDDIGRAAACSNVYCKVSGLPEQAKAEAGKAPVSPDYYRPIFDAVWDAFGGDRLIFGSNWPVSDKGASFDHVIRITKTYFEMKGRDVQEKVFHRNARNFYRWPAR
jgi:L-fuconolactonase